MAGRILGGRYQLLDELGAGGMATVWRAEDMDLGRLVAVKILHEDLVDAPGFRERFEREARNLASLNHPNIVVLHDWGIEGTSPYLVMELVKGETLRQRLGSVGRLPVADISRIGKEVLAGLQHAHDKGIIHRDIKPENLLLCDDDDGPFVKVADFGIAKGVGDERVTHAGLIGTPSYVSPEQAAGLPVSPASDIYSVGRVLEECLLGEAAARDQRHRGSVAHIESERPDAPPDFSRVLHRSLATGQAVRYQSAREMGKALSSATPPSGPRAEAGELSTIVPSKAVTRRKRWPYLVAAVILALGVVWSSRPSRQHAHGVATLATAAAGRTQAVVYIGFDKNLWIYQVATNTRNRLTDDGDRIQYQSPSFVDDHTITFARLRGSDSAASSPNSIWTMDITSLKQKQIVTSDKEINDFAWRPDGRMVAYFVPGQVMVADPTTGASTSIRKLPDETGGASRKDYGDDTSLAWSPDGSMLLVTDTATAPRSTMWVMKPDGADVVDPRSGTFGIWAPESNTIYYKTLGLGEPWYALSTTDGSQSRLAIRLDALSPTVGPAGTLAYNDSENAAVIYTFDPKTSTERRITWGLADPIWLGPNEIAATHAAPCKVGPDCGTPWDISPGATVIDLQTGRKRSISLDRTSGSARLPRF